MKFIKILLISVFILLGSLSNAEDPSPPPQNNNPMNGGTPMGGGAPIGGGTFILIGLGTAYGYAKYKLKNSR